MAKNGRNVEYMYGFTGKKTNTACMIIRTTDIAAAEKVLSDYVNSYEKNHSYHSIRQSLDIDENLKEMLIKALKNELIEDNQKHA